jgi:hypothetical protein
MNITNVKYYHIDSIKLLTFWTLSRVLFTFIMDNVQKVNNCINIPSSRTLDFIYHIDLFTYLSAMFKYIQCIHLNTGININVASPSLTLSRSNHDSMFTPYGIISHGRLVYKN